MSEAIGVPEQELELSMGMSGDFEVGSDKRPRRAARRRLDGGPLGEAECAPRTTPAVRHRDGEHQRAGGVRHLRSS